MSIEIASTIYQLYAISVSQQNYTSFDLIFVYNLDRALCTVGETTKGLFNHYNLKRQIRFTRFHTLQHTQPFWNGFKIIYFYIYDTRRRHSS